MNRDCIERTIRRDALPTCQLYSAVIRYPGPVTGGQNDRISSCRSIDASARVHRTRGNTSYANTTYRMLYETWIDVYVHTQSHAYTRMRTGSRTNSTDSLMDDTFVSSLRVHIARIIYEDRAFQLVHVRQNARGRNSTVFDKYFPTKVCPVAFSPAKISLNVIMGVLKARSSKREKQDFEKRMYRWWKIDISSGFLGLTQYRSIIRPNSKRNALLGSFADSIRCPGNLRLGNFRKVYEFLKVL